jgi:hypothetical protein
MPEDVAPESTAPAWVPVSLIGRRVVDVDGELVTLEFTLDLPDDKAWYQCFAQSRGPERSGSHTFVSTTPQFVTAELLSWKVELGDIPDAVRYLVERVEEANRDFVALLERKEQIRRQLEEAARRRQEAIANAQRILDDHWPVPDRSVAGREATEAAARATGESTLGAGGAQPLSEQAARSAPVGSRGTSSPT